MFSIKINFNLFLKYYPITSLIVCLCSVVIILQIYLGFTEDSIIILGGLDKELIESGYIWRFITYSFAHMSLFHYIINIPILIILARPIEKYYGSVLFLIVFLILSICAGMSIYYFFDGAYPLVGSSGAGYGLIGILAFLLLRYPSKISPYDKKFILYLLFFSLIFTISIPNLAISGHVGGFISGIIIAFIISLFKRKGGEELLDLYTAKLNTT
ncbi:rhomboid family intramembrane serine protease [Robertmurraya andreesenii]|uniref:Rhomboid protease GluP n=1 Tax=Anoxybacillus andreesenii TaxID=1325932 RepID=A0ABT9V6A6_9BACL|nr:rhomboid family intramembrane serine protease [Robertmurraya andreesenii]MDQ0156481.1 rhomboid protease GluP [Robertmurraya andreesenii]